MSGHGGAEHGGGHEAAHAAPQGGSPGFLNKLAGKAKAKGKKWAQGAGHKVEEWGAPEAQEYESFAGNLTGIPKDLWYGSVDNIVRRGGETATEIADNTRASIELLHKVVQPKIWRLNKSIPALAKATVGVPIEALHAVDNVVLGAGRAVDAGLLHGFNAIDHGVYTVRKAVNACVGWIPIAGTALKGINYAATSVPVIATKIARGVTNILGKVAGAPFHLLKDKVFTKYRNWALGNTEGHNAAATAANTHGAHGHAANDNEAIEHEHKKAA